MLLALCCLLTILHLVADPTTNILRWHYDKLGIPFSTKLWERGVRETFAFGEKGKQMLHVKVAALAFFHLVVSFSLTVNDSCFTSSCLLMTLLLCCQIEFPLARAVKQNKLRVDMKMPSNESTNREEWYKVQDRLIRMVKDSGVPYNEEFKGYVFGTVVISGDGINSSWTEPVD